MWEDVKLRYNKCRIWFLSIFTNRIKKIEIKDESGKTHKVTMEKKVEKVCDHKTIEEIAPTMWRCKGCKDVYFQISYKVMLTRADLLKYIEKLADHLGHDIEKDK